MRGLGAALVGGGLFLGVYGYIGVRLHNATSDRNNFADFHKRFCPGMLATGVPLVLIGAPLLAVGMWLR